jgi:hypothetical protein
LFNFDFIQNGEWQMAKWQMAKWLVFPRPFMRDHLRATATIRIST